MNRAWLDNFFKEYVFGFIAQDIQREINLAVRCPQWGGGNYLAALGLLCFTEVLGSLKRDTWGKRKTSKEQNFVAFFETMGDEYRKLDGANVYSLLRCGLVHQYDPSPNPVCDVKMLNTDDAPCGVLLEHGKYTIIVEKYFQDFDAAAHTLYEELKQRTGC